MKLYFRKIGEGTPLVVLHGVFGSSDNLFTVCKKIAESGFAVYTLDARNHGQSPRSSVFDYDVMAADLNDFLVENAITQPILLGHSMGGKTILNFSQKYDNFSKLIVVDIAPRFYPTHHNHILNGLAAINLADLENRKQAEEKFSAFVSDFGERQFILKNLYRTEDNAFGWRINVPVISENIYQIGAEIELKKIVGKPTLLIRGAESSYVTDDDFTNLHAYYPEAQLITVPYANHWVHATNPEVFVKAVTDFSLH